jgi:pimeloyl-ACP methyl ester carboxylesterase
MNDDAITPFRIDIAEQELADLAIRLERTRWPGGLPGTGWSDGVALRRVTELAAYWRDRFDWRAQEARLNQFPQFTTVIDGQRIHFLHVRSAERGAFPLVLTHGWPGSVAEFAEVIEPLTDPRRHGGEPADAFDVVVPSLPGFGFSSPWPEPGWGVERIARAWAELMRRLGYARYGAQGGDWGARISPQLARTDPEHVAGVHVNALVAVPNGTPGELESLDPDDLAALGGLRKWNAERSGYAQIMSTRPQTLAYALDDSPVGLLAWNLEWFDDYGEHPAAIAADAILANVALYWLTGTGGASGHIYKEAAASWGQAVARSEVPTAVAVFPGDSTVRAFAERDHNVVRWTRLDRGGHFAALQAPDLLVRDVREFFRGLR